MVIDLEKLRLKMVETINSMSDEELLKSLVECGLKLNSNESKLIIIEDKDYPRKPKDRRCTSCDFIIYAKCPTCGKLVQKGNGRKQERCTNCNQLLDWSN